MELRCVAPIGQGRTCGGGLGELPDLAGHVTQLVGVVLRWQDRKQVIPDPAQRDVRRCERCGWYSLYLVTNGRPATNRMARLR